MLVGATTTGHILAIIGADNSPFMRTSRDTKRESRAMKETVESNKPDIDANERPFVAAVKRAEAAKATLDDKIRKTITTIEAQLVKAGDQEANALGKVRVATEALNALREKGNVSAERMAAAEERLARAQRDVTAAQNNAQQLTNRLVQQRQALADAEVEVAAAHEAAADAAAKAAAEEEELADAADKAADSNDRASISAGKHAGSLLKLTAAVLGSQAAMMAGGLIAGAAVGAVPILAIAAAAVLLSSNERIAESYGDLADGVVVDAREMAQVLEDDLVGASDQLGASWRRLRGPLRTLFSESGPAVRELTRGVTEFAENAVGGMADSVKRSQPVMVGWRRLLSETGQGLGNFFRNASTDTEASGRNLDAFGKILNTILSSTGTLLQQLSTNAAPHADQFARVFQRIMDVITKVTENALPVFSTTLGIALDVLEAVLAVVEPIADTLGGGIGIILSAAAAWKVYAAAVALVSKVPLTSALTSSLAAAAPAGGILSRLGLGAAGAAAGTGALASAMSPLGIGLAATALLMGAYLLQQQKIDRGADSFVQGILKGGDAAQKSASDYASLEKALAALKAKRDAWMASDAARAAGADDVVGGKMNDEIYAMQQNVDAARKKWDEYLASVGPVEAAQAKLNLAIAQYGKDSPQATAAGAAYRAEVEKQEAASKAAADAVKSHTDKINENHAASKLAAGASLNYEASLLSLESAQKAMNDAIKAHGPASLEARTATNQYQQQLLGAVDAIGKKTAAENAGKSASEIATLVTKAETAEILRLASAAGTNAPTALAAMISKMDGAALAAMGVTVKVDEAGKAVVTMPDGKKIVITGENAEALRKIAEVNEKELRAKTLYINVITRADSKVAAANSADPGMNDGGWVPGNGPDRDDRLVPLTSREFVVNRRAAAKHGRLLEAINASEGGDVRMPESALASLPMPRTPATFTATTGGMSGGSRSTGGGGRAVHIGSINLTEVKTMPSKVWLRDTLTDIVEGVMVDDDE